MSNWQPIETAPKDGRWFCACDRFNTHGYRARWTGNGFESEEATICMKVYGRWSGRPPEMWTYLPDPPHMIPLPEPPE